MKYRLKHVLEFAALRAFAWPARHLPYRLALFHGWMHAALAFVIFRGRVREAVRRVCVVFGDRFTERDARRIAWISCRNIVFDAVEMTRLGEASRAWLDSVVDAQPGLAELERYAASGAGGIIAVPHMGSWEMAAVLIHKHGVPVFSIAATQKNPLVDAYINHLRRAPGIDTLARGSGTMKQVLRRLRQGGMLAILPDVRMRTAGVRVPFLGGVANLGEGMALFARHAGVPIFPCVVTRVGWARHRAVMGNPIHPDPSLDRGADIQRMTTEVMRHIEDAIRREPEQWFWFNRRWILDPID